MTHFNAQCFGPGAASHGENLSVEIRDGGFYFRPGGAVEDVHVRGEDMGVRAGGFHHDQLILSWTDADGGAWSLNIVTPQARQILLDHAPPALQTQLQRWRKHIKTGARRARAGWTALALLLASPFLLALVLWWQSERIINWAVSHIDIETERQLGDLIYAQTAAGLKLIGAGPDVAMIEQLGARLTAGAPYTFHWHVADDPQVNAFAIPGGHVVVFTGFIKAAGSREEIAGVLAHEVQHVLQRHSLKAMAQAAGWQAVLALAFGDLGGATAQQLATGLGTLHFSRQNESEADMKGMELLQRANINPAGMLRFFERMNEQEGPRIALFSTHPPSAERLNALREALARQPPREYSPLE